MDTHLNRRPLQLIRNLVVLFFLPVCAAEGQYVTKSGQQFIYQGNPITFYGASIYPAADGGSTAWHTTTFTPVLHKMVTNAMAGGQDILRPTDYWNSSDASQTFNDSTLWANMDFLMADCKTNGMFVLMDISAWKKVLSAQGKNQTDTNNWLAFIDFVSARYKNEPAIAFWSIMGEPSVPQSQSEADALVRFYDTLTTYLDNKDGNHLICAGGFNHMNQNQQYNWWQNIFALAHNDADAYKTYSQNDLNLTPTIGSVAASHSKILINEEFGMPQSQGDGTWSGQTYNGIQTDMADFYQNVYNAGESAGAVGFLFWNMARLSGGSHYDVWPDITPTTWGVIQSYSPPPQPPLGLSATAAGVSQINLSWTDSPEATVRGYNVYRSTTSGFTPGSGNRIAGASQVPNNSYSDTGVASGTTYYYLVSAVNQLNHESDPSAQASATTGNAVVFYEAEALATYKNGGTLYTNNDSGLSGAHGVELDSTGTGNSVTFSVYVPVGGIAYDIRLGIKKNTNRGQFQFATASTPNGPTWSNHGAPFDEYNASAQYTEIDLGTITFGSPATKGFRFTVTGKNSSSSSYNGVFDYIKLVPP